MKIIDALKYANNILEDKINYLNVNIVAQVLEPRGHDNIVQCNCSKTEHFTTQEFNEIYNGIVDAGFFVKRVFFSEFDFLRDIISQPEEYSTTIVFNLCRNGTGMNKKTVVPAVCDLLNVAYTSSSAGLCALARNKWLFTSYLSANGIRCPVSGFHPSDLYNKLPQNSKVICKPNCESASQGISTSSIITLEQSNIKFDKKILIQEYIDGYECEVPIFSSNGKAFALPPVGIKFSSNSHTGILSYDDSLHNKYSFYDLSLIVNKTVYENIMSDAVAIFNLLGLQTYGRIDFRIDKNTHKHYVMDISTTPYITHHSSFAFMANQLDIKYSDIFKLIVADAILRKP